MSRLPTPGADSGSWGDILNDFLTVAHNSDGTLKSSALVSAGAVTSIPLKPSIRTVTSNYTIVDSDGVVVVNSSGTVTVTLPSATASGVGKQFVVKSIGSGSSVVNSNGGDIDGLSQLGLGDSAAAFVSDGTDWITLNSAPSAVSHQTQTVSSNYNISVQDGVVIATAAGITLSLPSGTIAGAGKQFTLKNVSSGIIFANALGGSIDGGSSVNVGVGVTQTYVSDGTNWVLLQERGAEALLKTAQTVTSNYTVGSTDSIIFANGSSVTVMLPSATNAGAGRQYIVKNINAANAFVNAAGGNVEGTGQVTLGQGVSFTFTSDGTDWWET